ncbi:hypothetical protein CBL_20779 [Carabus blaptoides fortunei]
MVYKYVCFPSAMRLLQLHKFYGFDEFAKFIRDLQHTQFHVRVMRDRVREFCQQLESPAPFAEDVRFPDKFYVHLGDGNIRLLINQLIHSLDLPFRLLEKGTKEVGNSLSDAKRSFDAAVDELGGSKHGIAFLMWVHRRCRDPAPTETDCYWKKSILPKVGSSFKLFMTVGFNGPVPTDVGAASMSAVLSTNIPGTDNCEEFLLYLKKNVTDEILKQAAQATQTQYKSQLWFELRYGRIIASRVHEVANCKTISGTIVEYIMGAARVPDTAALKRGRVSEDYVREALEDKFNVIFHTSGFLICKD